jgi:hypothetical protein
MNDFSSIQLLAAQTLVREIGPQNIELVPSPPSTLDRGLMKKNLAAGKDVWHAKKAYGATILIEVLRRIGVSAQAS